jgi:adenylosuccinate synthase
MRTSVVIGANFGDEGKGLTVDYLAAQGSATVVRFNGGAQAGHTVVTTDGKRHVFHHFGSGSFSGAPTFLARGFVVNPILFVKEFAELKDKIPTPAIYIDPRCPLTTPFDIILNHAIERQRGDKRHGSCGAGFNETLQRTKTAFNLHYTDLSNQKTLKNKLQWIRDKYVPRRMEELGLDGELPYLHDSGIIDHFLSDCGTLTNWAHGIMWGSFCEGADEGQHLIFEGAQGLMLDMDHPNFPHTTHSKTGLPYVAELAREVGITKLDAYYVSRTYLTRHGAGPLPWEVSRPDGVMDETNVPNEHQGDLRFGLIDQGVLVDTIKEDLITAFDLNVTPHFVLTCADQTDDKVVLAIRGMISADLFAKTAVRAIGGTHYLISRGPTRNDIKEGTIDNSTAAVDNKVYDTDVDIPL